MASQQENAIIGGVDPWKMYEWDRYLSQEIGSRMSGTENDRKSIDWISKHFKGRGLKVELDKFNTLSWDYEGTTFTVSDPLNETLHSRAAYYSYNTPDGGVEGELVFVGMGTEDEFAASNVKGKIATIGSTDAMGLLHAMGAGGVRAKIKVDCVTEPRDGFNVRAFIPGTDKPGERVLIHGHRDDGACNGANDNGTGTVALMMLAEIMAGLPAPKRTIEIMSTGSEEGISDGMVQYIANREKEGNLLGIVAGFNMDMIGVGGPARIVDGGVYPDQPDHHVKHNKELNDFVEDVGREIGVHLGHLWGGWGTPEEGHLNEHGVPGMCIWKADDPNYHSDNEHVDNVDWNAVKAVAQVIGVAAWRVANDTGIEFPR